MSNLYFSVIIPCYNVSKYLCRCLDSIINQSFADIEIIIIDDKSTDNSLSIAHKYEHSDNRIKVIALDKNHGVAYARNVGIKSAKGEYVSFIDPDDFIDLNFYEKIHQKSMKNKADIIKASAVGVKDISAYIPINKYYFYAQWWSAVYKMELLNQYNILFPEDIFCGQDFVFQRHVCMRAKTVILVGDTRYHYCKRNGSLDSKFFSQKKIESQLLARKYIILLANELIPNDADYLLVILRTFSEIQWLWSKTTNCNSRHIICRKYIELFGLINHTSLFASIFPMLYLYLQNKDEAGLFRHLSTYNKNYKYLIMDSVQPS